MKLNATFRALLVVTQRCVCANLCRFTFLLFSLYLSSSCDIGVIPVYRSCSSFIFGQLTHRDVVLDVLVSSAPAAELASHHLDSSLVDLTELDADVSWWRHQLLHLANKTDLVLTWMARSRLVYSRTNISRLPPSYRPPRT